MKTLKQYFQENGKEPFTLVLANGKEVNGYLVQERVDKNKDTEGFNIYDIRSGETEDGYEIYYCTLEPNVRVDWADSIAVEESIDFGPEGYLNIEVDDEEINEMREAEEEEYEMEELNDSKLPSEFKNKFESKGFPKSDNPTYNDLLTWLKESKHIIVSITKYDGEPTPEETGYIYDIFNEETRRLESYDEDPLFQSAEEVMVAGLKKLLSMMETPDVKDDEIKEVIGTSFDIF